MMNTSLSTYNDKKGDSMRFLGKFMCILYNILMYIIIYTYIYLFNLSLVYVMYILYIGYIYEHKDTK